MSVNAKVYMKQGADELVVASGGKITIEAGGELELASGSTLDLGDGLSEPGDITLADGKIVVGNAAGVGAAVTPSGDVTITNTGVTAIGAKKVLESMTAIADGKVLIGDAAGAGAAKTLTGDITMTREGVTAIGAGKVTSAMLANGAGLAALIAAGLGASAAYVKTTAGAQTLLAPDAAARVALIVVTVDETFDNGDGAQTTFTVGETDTAGKFAAAAVFTGATAGSVFVLAGALTATKALIVTGTAATGTGTGGVSVTALVLDAAV